MMMTFPVIITTAARKSLLSLPALVVCPFYAQEYSQIDGRDKTCNCSLPPRHQTDN